MTMTSDDRSRLEYSEVHRNLADPVYKINKFGLRLTTGDALVCGVAWFATFVLARIVAGRRAAADEFEWGPLAALAVGAALAYGLTIMHKVRPELSLENLIKQGGAEFSAYCSAALPDRKWNRQSWKR